MANVEANPSDPDHREVLESHKPKIVILGSFRYIDRIKDLIKFFEENGVSVAAPRVGNVVKDDLGFRILDIDENRDPVEIESDYLWELSNADAGYLVNDPEQQEERGYVGFMSFQELDFCLRRGIPVYAMVPLDSSLEDDWSYKRICNKVATCSPNELIDRLKRKSVFPVESEITPGLIPFTRELATTLAATYLTMDGLRRTFQEDLDGRVYLPSLNDIS